VPAKTIGRQGLRGRIDIVRDTFYIGYISQGSEFTLGTMSQFDSYPVKLGEYVINL